MRNNKGLSLVELLVAISIAAIVAGSVGMLLTTSLRMYGKEVTEVSLQQELQITINQIEDSAMESQTIVSDFDGVYPDFLAIGTYSGTSLKSQIIWKDGNKLYLKRETIDDYDDESSDTKYQKIVNLLPNSEGGSQTVNLLAEYVKTFNVSVDGLGTDTDDEGNTLNVYENPLSLNIKLEFEKNPGGGSILTKNVDDKATLRNKVKKSIYVNGIKYEFKEEKDLVLSTETVSSEQKLGYIQTEGDINGGLKTSMRILEIVPDYSYDLVQFVLGGPNGELLNTINTTYGQSAGITPITSSEFESFLIRKCGTTNDSDNINGFSGFFPNNGADIPSIALSPKHGRVGYYEYVGESNGGIYGIDSMSTELVKATNPGYGTSRPKIIAFSKERVTPGQYDSYRCSDMIYSPIFEFVDHNDGSNDYYIPREVDGRADYRRVIRHIDDQYNPRDEFLYYEYAGPGQGDVALEFYRYYAVGTQSYNANQGKGPEYKVSGGNYRCTDFSNGSYYAIYSGFDERTSADVYEDGYDYLEKINDVIAISKHSGGTPQVSGEFGWVWHELKEGDSQYSYVRDGDVYTSAPGIRGGLYFSASNADDKRIYLQNHSRASVVNNEIFKLTVMQSVFESFVDTTPQVLNIRNGIWDTTYDTYCDVNNNALKRWEQAGNKVYLDVRTPGDITATDISGCDMVIVADSNDGGFDWASQCIHDIRGTTYTSRKPFSDDITFAQALYLYKKVLNEEISLICPSAMRTYGGSAAANNMSKLFAMVYSISNEDITKEDVFEATTNTYKVKKQEEQGANNYWNQNPNYQSKVENMTITAGSGREFFSDLLKSMASDAMSKNLYDDNTLPKKTSDYIYIDDSGNLVIPSVDESFEGYAIKNSGKNLSTWGNILEVIEGNFTSYILSQGKNRNYFADVYESDNTTGGNGKTAFVYNDSYGHYYKFIYNGDNEGVYKNTMLYNQDSPLLKFDSTGNRGMVLISSIKESAKKGNGSEKAEVIGRLEFIGASDIASGDARRSTQNSRGTENIKFEDEPLQYSKRLEKITGGSDKKILYLTEEEFEKAKTEGLYLYVLVKTSKDPSFYNKCVLWYTKNDGDKWRYDYDDDIHPNAAWAGEYQGNYENSSNSVAYHSGNSADESYVREYRYRMDPLHFANLTPVFNTHNGINNNVITAKIEAGPGKPYIGSDELVIVIRDTFDLD